MTANVIPFVPKANQSARDNVADFIDFCKHKVTIFGGDLPFDNNTWDITDWMDYKGRNHRVRLHFRNLETATSKVDWSPMAEPYLSFAKAYVRYPTNFSPKRGFSGCLTTLRVLEAALVELTGGRDPTDIRPDVLNRAAQILRERYAPNTAYSCGIDLQLISRLACELRLVAVPSPWTNTIPAAEKGTIRVGKEFDELRMEKVPSPAAFYALGHIFQNGTDAEDILVSSACALLCSAPSRISEVVLLPSACEVTQTDKETGNLLYGLGWRPAKNGAPMVKYVPTPMHDVVREALQRLRTLSAPALELVRWYERNPERLYLPPELEHLREKSELSSVEVNSILYVDDGKDSKSRVFHWTKTMKLQPIKRKNKNYFKFADIEAAVIGMLPRGFPILDKARGLRYSDALMVVRKQELDPSKVTYKCMFQAIEPNDIAGRLGSRPTVNILTKHGFKEDDGTVITLATHKFRHYLNTLSQSNNMDQLDVARWSGRRHVSQNAAYDHVSDREVTRKLRLALQGEASAAGPIARLHKVALIPRDEFARLRIPTAHTTDFGYCVHDFTMLPCSKHQDCMNCDEQACIKGLDATKENNIRSMRDETKLLLDKANKAAEDGECGADRWVAHQQLTLGRLNSLCSILDDPAVPSGAVIRLDESTAQTPIEQAMQLRPMFGDAHVLEGPGPAEAAQ